MPSHDLLKSAKGSPLGAASRSHNARIGATLGVPVNESGDPARGTIIGELTKRVASERLR